MDLDEFSNISLSKLLDIISKGNKTVFLVADKYVKQSHK